MSHQYKSRPPFSEERWRVTLSSIGDGIIATDAQGKVSFLNPIAEGLTGWTQLAAEGRPLEEIFHIVNEASGARVENPFQRVLEKGHVVGIANHTMLITKAGRRLPIDDSAAPIRDDRGELVGVVLVFRDISERRQAEEAMRIALQHLEAVANTMASAVTLCSSDLRYLWVSPAYAQWLRKEPEEIAGRKIVDVIGNEGYEAIRPHIEQVLSGKTEEYEELVNYHGLGSRWIHAVYVPTKDSADSVNGWVAVVTDITARKQMENQ
jgi:PAS domain S-box-containing protein